MGLEIALVDDHILVRNAISDLLKKNNYEIVCEADNGRIFLDYLSVNPLPDVVLLDINMPEMDGYATMEAIARKYKEHKVIALSMYDDERSIFKMIKAGVKGYLLKESQPSELIDAIESVYKDGIYYSSIVNAKMVKTFTSTVNKTEVKNNLMEFSAKELEIMQMFCTELSYKEIGAKLGISGRTVESYREILMEKTGIKTRIGLILFAIKNGIVKL